MNQHKRQCIWSSQMNDYEFCGILCHLNPEVRRRSHFYIDRDAELRVFDQDRSFLYKLFIIFLKHSRLFVLFLKRANSWPLFLYIYLFNTVSSAQMFNIKICQCLDSKCRPQMSDATTLPTEQNNHCPK